MLDGVALPELMLQFERVPGPNAALGCEGDSSGQEHLPPVSAGVPAVTLLVKGLHAPITSGLNYCYSLYMALAWVTARKLQRVQNEAEHMLTGASRF